MTGGGVEEVGEPCKDGLSRPNMDGVTTGGTKLVHPPSLHLTNRHEHSPTPNPHYPPFPDPRREPNYEEDFVSLRRLRKGARRHQR